MSIYQQILSKKYDGKKQFAVLVDPDKVTENGLKLLAAEAEKAAVDYFLLGGSLLTTGSISQCIKIIRSVSSIPIILFPGNVQQATHEADAILFLSLISGRNPDLLIGHHVEAAPIIKKMKLEVISTGYMLIESGNRTTVQYISNTFPIPADKPDIAASTALAGEMLGLKLIYAEAGSGALNPVGIDVIKAIKKQITIPLIVGGGIKTPEKAIENCRAGADIIVVGNSIEKDISLLKRMSEAVHNN